VLEDAEQRGFVGVGDGRFGDRRLFDDADASDRHQRMAGGDHEPFAQPGARRRDGEADHPARPLALGGRGELVAAGGGQEILRGAVNVPRPCSRTSRPSPREFFDRGPQGGARDADFHAQRAPELAGGQLV
jgi:hypothetical protein